MTVDGVDCQKGMFYINNFLLDTCSLLHSIIQLAMGGGVTERSLLGKYFIIE